MTDEATSGAGSPAGGCTDGLRERGFEEIAAVVLAAALLAAGAVADAAAQDAPAGAQLGERVYEKSCARCHGTDGRGIPGVYPALAGDPFVTASEELPVQVVLEGRAPSPTAPPMPAFADLLTDEEIAAVVSYIRGRWSNDAGPVGTGLVAEVRARGSDEEGEGEPAEMPAGWRAEGERLYQRFCAACHQDRGEGAEGIFPELAGNPFVTGSPPGPLVRVLLQGRGGMPAFARQLNDEELAALLSYIRTAWGNRGSPIAPAAVEEVPRP